MIILRFSKLIKLDNRANALSFWLPLSQILCKCSVKDEQLFTLTILYLLSPSRNISFFISCDQKIITYQRSLSLHFY